jgi:hypothetical protein
VPVALADQLLDIARRLDAGETLTPETSSIAKTLLAEALALKPNAGGQIKAKIRAALELL